MDLNSFMERVKATDTDLAEVVGCARSTVGRIRRKEFDPRAKTLLRINRWAARVAEELGLGWSERLTWEHLHDEDSAA